MPHPAVKTANEARAIAADARAGLVLKYRAAKMSWSGIAEELRISESTVRSLYRRERDRLRDTRAELLLETLEEELDGLDAIEAQANAIALGGKTVAERLKAMNVVLSVKKQRAALLGLNAPERMVLFPGDNGAGPADLGADVPLEALEAMSDDELAAQIEQQRSLRVVTTTGEDTTPKDDDEPDSDPYDGAPDEVVIEDPGPRAVAPAPAEEEPDGGE